MEVNDQNLAVLRDLLQNTMSPITATRRQAEEMIKSTEAQAGFSILLLTLISRLSVPASPDDIAIRQSASVFLKNFVKKRWAPVDDSEAPISAADRDALKTVVINMMSTSPPDVQKQLSEGISIIAKYDFPEKWGNLLPELVSQLNTPDLTMLKGVMLTANSIMKRFRDAFKSDELFSVILLCLANFAEPLTIKYAQVATAIEQSANDKQQLITLLEIQRLMSRVFYSLNWQDIPEYFEDNLSKWAELFAKFLQYSNPLVTDAGEDKEPGPIESLQAAILDNLNLYATKYEDVFQPYLELFTQLVWKRLMEIGPEPKYDIIATSAIRFLTSVCSKDVNRGLFSDAVLKDIVQHIIVRNLMATEADEELFEDNPIDYIHKDMEGSDQDTRRRSAMEFVRALMKFFPQQVSLLCVDYINAMLESYRISRDWKAKDAAMHLILCVAVKSGTVATGASEINPLIDVLGIFSTHVLPEIHDANVNGSAAPIIKADALKLICVFRSQFDAPFLLILLEHVLRFLTAKNVVIQTYAALCIERFLSVKDKSGTASQPRINKQALAPFFEPLFGGLFNALVNPSLGENEYVMKCIMRASLVVGSDISPVTELVVQHLTSALEKACKNPVNPHYNHYLFESLALLIRASCGNGIGEITPALVASCSHFEALLFPPLQTVLAHDISEFVPYCFQILAQLLGARPANSGLTDAYRALFVPLLVPAVWEQKGNIPALVDLFKSYISRGMGEIIAGNFLEGVLGIFQKLLAAKSTETHAFALLNVLISFCPQPTIQPYLPTIFELLLKRLQEAMKVSRQSPFIKHFVHEVCMFAAVYGASVVYEVLERTRSGLTANLVGDVWYPNAAQCATGSELDLKHIVIGGTKLLIDTPLAEGFTTQWQCLFRAVLTITYEGNAHILEINFDAEDAVENREFDGHYSKLTYASIPVVDPCAEIASAGAYFGAAMTQFAQVQPGVFNQVLSVLTSPEREALQKRMSL